MIFLTNLGRINLDGSLVTNSRVVVTRDRRRLDVTTISDFSGVHAASKRETISRDGEFAYGTNSRLHTHYIRNRVLLYGWNLSSSIGRSSDTINWLLHITIWKKKKKRECVNNSKVNNLTILWWFLHTTIWKKEEKNVLTIIK